MASGLVKGRGIHRRRQCDRDQCEPVPRQAPNEIVWAQPERQTAPPENILAVVEAATQPNPDRKPPKVISPSDPRAAWTANSRTCLAYLRCLACRRYDGHGARRWRVATAMVSIDGRTGIPLSCPC
jgi:hypothetical protein